jgi:hypothetical protein
MSALMDASEHVVLCIYDQYEDMTKDTRVMLVPKETFMSTMQVVARDAMSDVHEFKDFQDLLKWVIKTAEPIKDKKDARRAIHKRLWVNITSWQDNEDPAFVGDKNVTTLQHAQLLQPCAFLFLHDDM